MNHVALDLVAELERAWQSSDRVFALINRDAYAQRPIRLRHPFVFYLGHLPAFAWNQLKAAGLVSSMDARFEDLFERGIDPLSDAEAETSNISAWPTIDEIRAYRDRVRSKIRALGEELTDKAEWVMYGIIEHELMHVETLLYMVQRLDHGHKVGSTQLAPTTSTDASPNPWVPIEAGRVRLGARLGEFPFSWDNEVPGADVDVAAFELQRTPVTNHAFMEFVSQGGYRDRGSWSDEGWHWIQSEARAHPESWQPVGDGWRVRALLSDLDFDQVANWPVNLAYNEAQAFSRWSGARLPSEAEFHRAAFADDKRAFTQVNKANVGLERGSPTPVGSFGENDNGVCDLIGNGWEWTSSVFEPFDGFRVTLPSYPGYSADFFDGRHQVMLGGSWATDRALMRPSFRNWFQRNYPYVFSQFRLAR